VSGGVTGGVIIAEQGRSGVIKNGENTGKRGLVTTIDNPRQLNQYPRQGSNKAAKHGVLTPEEALAVSRAVSEDSRLLEIVEKWHLLSESEREAISNAVAMGATR